MGLDDHSVLVFHGAGLDDETQEGDLVIWDNRCVLHRATPFDAARDRRLMQRTTIAGDADELAPRTP